MLVSVRPSQVLDFTDLFWYAVLLVSFSEAAQRLAAQTLLGAARMVLDTKKSPGQLKDEVRGRIIPCQWRDTWVDADNNRMCVYGD